MWVDGPDPPDKNLGLAENINELESFNAFVKEQGLNRGTINLFDDV